MRKTKALLSSITLAMALSTACFAKSSDLKYWNFNDVDIHSLIQQVATETGKNFVIDPRVQGKVTVISHKALSKEEAFQVFLSVLKVHGYGAVQTGNMVQIVPLDKAKTSGNTLNSKGLYDTDTLVIKVLDLKYVSSDNILKSLKPLVPKTSYIASIDETNNLVIADTSSNIKRLESIVNELDSVNGQLIEMVEIEHASSVELAETLGRIVAGKRGAKSTAKPLQIEADARTNSLLIAGGTRELRAYVLKLIDKLDAQTDNQYNSEVIYLKFSDASNIAPIVATFLEDAMRTSEKPQERNQLQQKNNATDYASRSRSSSGEAPSNHLRALRGFDSSSNVQGSLFGENEGRPKSGVINQFVQWEETTNALIVKAPPNLMRAVKSIIAKLDIRRPQVMIEVIIAEINLDRATELGVEWDVSPSAEIKFGTRFTNAANQANGILGDFAGGAVGQLGTGLTVGVFRHGNLRVLAKALAADSSANILSTPTLVTLDNQTALIKVGEKVPFAIGETNNANVGGNPFTSFDREEVGLSLTIRPQITLSGAIKLEIENILSNIIQDSQAANAGGNPRTSERTIVTNVMVDDGKVLVLGGLIQESWQEVHSEVPLLGRVPLVGNLFKGATKQLVKRNLMIFLKPKILRDDLEGIELSTTKYNRMRFAQRHSYQALDHPMVDEPIMIDPLSHNDYYPSDREPAARIENRYPGLFLPPPFGS